jgi:hypothetical protein
MLPRSSQLLIAENEIVTCPKCDKEFTLDEGFARKALEQLANSSAEAIADLRRSERAEVEKIAQNYATEKARATESEVKALKKLLDDQAQQHAEIVAQVQLAAERAIAPRLQEMRVALAARQAEVQALQSRAQGLEAKEREIDSRIKSAASSKAAELIASERKLFEEQLADKDTQLANLRDQELALRKLQAQLHDERNALELSAQRRADELVQQRESAVRAQEQERHTLREAELHKTIADMRSQLVDAQRKADQGSQQTQGEVLELAIEEGLRRAFPMDSIEEVKKGQRGGDMLQHVITRTGQTAGTVLWETKRAKEWSTQWIPKLKEDMRACGAGVGVLVTMPGALPKEWPGSAYFALHEDVWVTQASCAIGVAEALRVGLIDLHRQRAVSAGKGEKMEALYDYLTSPQFAQKLKAVYETFTRMREELESEKSVTTQRWARREKQLQGGMTQLLGIGGEIQGLAQEELPMLEMEPQRDMPL